jgi:hypothetical protein
MNELRIYYRRYPLLAAVLYSIPVLIYLFNTAYQNVWILYVGNILFCGIVLWALIHFNHKVRDEASIRSMFLVGLKITLYGLIIASIACFIFLGIKYYFFNAYPAANSENKLLEQSPSQAGHDTSGELLSALFMNTVVVNAVLGGLAAALGASVAKKNQKTEKGKTMF